MITKQNGRPEGRPFRGIFARDLDRPAELLDAVEARLDRLEIGRVAQAHRFVVAEGDARDHGDLGPNLEMSASM
jgi:hypothetical protein